MTYSLRHNKKGSVAVMAIILTAGMLIAAVEFSVYTINSLRQARNVDRSLIAYYAAESGAESALHQLRKRPLVTDSSGKVILSPQTGVVSAGTDQDNATWDLRFPQFSDTSDTMRTTRLAKNQSLAIPLYAKDGLQPLDIHSMKVTWESESNCDGGSGPAWVQSKVATWTSDGGAVGTPGTLLQWSDNADKVRNVRQYLKTPSGAVKEVTFNDVSSNPATSEIFPEKLKEQPMIVQVTPLYCDLYGVNISFYGATGNIAPMSNIYTIAPQGDYQGVRQQLHLTLPGQVGTGLSSLFDYVLFSESTVEKN